MNTGFRSACLSSKRYKRVREAPVSRSHPPRVGPTKIRNRFGTDKRRTMNPCL